MPCAYPSEQNPGCLRDKRINDQPSHVSHCPSVFANLGTVSSVDATKPISTHSGYTSAEHGHEMSDTGTQQPVGLLPCPFCSSNAELLANLGGEHYVECKRCWSHGSKFLRGPDDAVAAWNSRPMRESVTPAIPDGWRFHTADFSLSPGRVTLIRDEAGKKWWFSLTDEEREEIDLYVGGHGDTLTDAIANAVTKIKEQGRR
jgi:hypothetical protein